MTQATSLAQKLESDLKSRGFPPFLEYKFLDNALWRFDLAFPSIKLAVEIDGHGAGGHAGYHGTHQGRKADCAKANAAIENGWRVLRYPAGSVAIHKRRARIVEQIARVACGVEDQDEAKIVLDGD